MIKAGSWQKDKRQLHRFIDLKDVEIKKGVPFYLKGQDFYLDNDHILGTIQLDEVNDDMMCDTGSMSWDLHIDKVIPYNVGYGTSDLLRKLKAFEMYWHVSGMKSLYEGYVIYQGIRYTVNKDTCYGYADKNWGSNFTSPWVWLSSNDIISNLTNQRLYNTVFDFGGGKPRILVFPLIESFCEEFILKERNMNIIFLNSGCFLKQYLTVKKLTLRYYGILYLKISHQNV